MTENEKLENNDRVRFEYCSKLYEREFVRKEELERKSQFLFTIILLFVSAIFVNLDFFVELNSLFAQKKVCSSLVWLVYIVLAFHSFFIALGSISILNSVKMINYKNVNNKKVKFTLFDPDSTYLNDSYEVTFLKTIGVLYAEAFRINKEINDKKAECIKKAWYGVIFTTISFLCFLLLYSYIAIFI